MRDPALETTAAELEGSGEHRVLRRLAPRKPLAVPSDLKVISGLFVDVETTGLDPTHDEIIELAMAPFAFSAEGRIFDVGDGSTSGPGANVRFSRRLDPLRSSNVSPSVRLASRGGSGGELA